MPAVEVDKNRQLEVASFSIKYNDVFSLDDLYEGLKEWLEEYEWKGYDSDLKDDDADKAETHYSEVVGSAGRELSIRWRLKKERSFFFRWYFDITQETLAMKKTETVVGGKKITLDKGSYEIKVKAILEFDKEKGFSKGTYKPFRLFFLKFYKDRIEEEERELYREAYIFQSFIKKWLDLKGVIPFEGGKTVAYNIRM